MSLQVSLDYLGEHPLRSPSPARDLARRVVGSVDTEQTDEDAEGVPPVPTDRRSRIEEGIPEG